MRRHRWVDIGGFTNECAHCGLKIMTVESVSKRNPRHHVYREVYQSPGEEGWTEVGRTRLPCKEK